MNMASTADHEILIRLEEGKHAIPPNPMPAMKVGETVRYLSYDGQVTNAFSGAVTVQTRRSNEYRGQRLRTSTATPSWKVRVPMFPDAAGWNDGGLGPQWQSSVW